MKRLGWSRAALRSSYCRSNKTIRQFHNIFDFFRTGGLPSSNPVTEDILTRKGSEDESEIIRSPQLPSYSKWKPIHLEDAAEACKLHHEERASQFEKRLCDAQSFFKNENVNSEKASSVLSGIVSDWDQLLSPLNQLQNSSYMLYLMSEESEKSNWGQAFDRLSSILPDSTTDLTGEGNNDDATHLQIIGLLGGTLHEALAKVDVCSANHGDATWAARYLERSIRKNLGLGLSEEEKSLFDSIQSTLSTVERNILERESAPTKGGSASFLSDCYSLLDLRRRNAALLGYSNFGELVLEERMASVDEVRNFHEDLAAGLLPLVEGIDQNPFDPKVLDANNVMKPTLNGCLMAINKVTSDLFGVEIREDNTSERDRAAWSRDVRLLNLYDHDNKGSEGESQYLGSILLDPYKRPGKMNRSFLIPLRFRGEHSQPLVGISLCTATPVWDDVSADISWDDAEALWHEVGHALQIILAKPSYGGICGAHNLALDVSEILPKFMEHCLFDRSNLPFVMECSESEANLSSPMIDVILQRRCHQKSLQMMQHLFYGELELELFTRFVPNGDESMVGLQRRLSSQFLPHDMPAHNDLSPLLKVFRENASGPQLAFYRYLWSEVYCAGIFQHVAVSEKAQSRLGRELRHHFLTPGATCDYEKALKNFDGTTMGTIDPLFELYDMRRTT